MPLVVPPSEEPETPGPEQPEPQTEEGEELLPLEGDAGTPDEELDAVVGLPGFDEEPPEDLVVTTEEPPPLGKSWAFDFGVGKFKRVGAGGPAPTYGLTTLRYWIEKCLMTEAGAHPIHDQGYGVRGLNDLIGTQGGLVMMELESRITEAVTWHPRISGIENFSATHDPMQEYVDVAFTVVVDEPAGTEERMDVGTRIGG